jgi:parvulin-like peptidyl-prolyl isomerase
MVKNNSKVSASHILIMHKESQDSRSSITKDSAKKKIDNIHQDILDGKVSFADAAVQNSDCSSGQSGGNLGEFAKGMMVKAFEDVAFSMEINEVSKPFESEFGFHIVKRDA